MSAQFNDFVISTVKNQEQAAEVVEKLFAVARPGAVFSEPVNTEDYTVITAAEVTVGMGFGSGGGFGSEPRPAKAEDEASVEGNDNNTQPALGGGSGGGGGGVSAGRPVAVISIGPDGVRVEPIVDPTKIALAFFVTLGSMLITLSRMFRASRR